MPCLKFSDPFFYFIKSAFDPHWLFFHSVIVFFSSVTSVWNFLIFSIFKFSLCLSILLLSLVGIFMIIYWTFYQVNYFISSSLTFFPDVLHCSFIWNIFLFLHFAWFCAGFYALGEKPPLPLELLPLCKRWTFFIPPCPSSWFSLNYL